MDAPLVVSPPPLPWAPSLRAGRSGAVPLSTEKLPPPLPASSLCQPQVVVVESLARASSGGAALASFGWTLFIPHQCKEDDERREDQATGSAQALLTLHLCRRHRGDKNL